MVKHNEHLKGILIEENHINVVGFGEKSTGIKFVIVGVHLPMGLRESEGIIDLSKVYFKYFEKMRNGFSQSFSYLQKHGYHCEAVSPISLKEDLRGLARISGIGQRGLNRSILHKHFGGNLLFSAFYTNAPIETFRGEAPEYCVKCGECIRICPGRAINKEGVSIVRCSPYSLRACQKCLDVCPIGDLKSTYN